MRIGCPRQYKWCKVNNGQVFEWMYGKSGEEIFLFPLQIHSRQLVERMTTSEIISRTYDNLIISNK